jgi:hypothetical protein
MSINGFYRLFPTVVGDATREDLVKPVQKVIDSLSENDWAKYTSKSVNVLQKHPKIKKEFTKTVKEFLRLGMLIQQDITMTTSWLTKNTPSMFAEHRHRHTNCWYSAVFYLQDNSHIKFERDNPQIYVAPKEWNMDNSSTYTLVGKKGTLFIFPSFTFHTPMKGDSNFDIRYSLAMNFMPVGTVGDRDSTYTYSK